MAALWDRLTRAVTLELLLYALFVAVAASTRFWDLGSRPLHHDESLHAYFSWKYYMGSGYQHDPMMHGPLQFHMVALAYALFGDSDFVARVPAAIWGTITVGLPFLLRRQLGRVSMLVASFLLLISPDIWYYGRFIRNEAWGVPLTLLVFIGLVRWLDSRRAVWLHAAWIAWVFLYTDKAVSFIVLFIFVTAMLVALGLARARAVLAWLAALPVGVLAAFVVLPGVFGWGRLPAIPFDEPSLQKSLAYAREMAASGQVQTSLLWTVLWAVVAVLLLRRARLGRQWESVRDGASADALTRALVELGTPRGWRSYALHAGVMLAAFVSVAAPLYTSLFTNVRGGLMSGSFGQLFYWLAQHDVQRGNQPWYYYAVMLPVYEPIPTLLALGGIGWGLWWGARWLRERSRRPLGTMQLAYAMLMWWSVLGFVIYSYLGEKMPWLLTHITLPLIMLSAVWGARALRLEDGWRGARAPKRAGRWVFVAAAALVTGWAVYAMAPWSQQTAPVGQAPVVWGLLALAVIGAAAVWWLGRAAALRSIALLALLVLGLYTVRSAVLLSYENGAVPVEQQVYVQSSPRVTNTIDAIRAVSERTAGGLNAQIIYDNTVSWPFVWYLRDYPNARFMGEGPQSVPSGDVQFVVVGDDKEAKIERYMAGYTAYRYPMRWWFPEEMYRSLVPEAQVEGKAGAQRILTSARYVLGGVASLVEPRQQARLWRYVAYRVPDGVLNSTDMVVYVRNDLVGLWNRERL